MKENKEDSHIFFKDLNLLYHLMPSNSLTLGLYELSISKRTFQHTTGFFLFREELFATGEKVWSLSSIYAERK